MNIIIIITAGIALFVFFRIMRMLLPERIALSKTFKLYVFRVLYIVEAFIWLVFLFWALFNLLGEKSYFPYLIISLVVVLVLLVGWFVLKDVIAGFVLRFQYKLAVDKSISLKSISGKIIKLGMMHFQVEKSGNIVNIPYSKISSEIISEFSEGDSNQAAFKLAVGKPISIDKTIDQIRYLLLNSPYVAPRHEPLIIFDGETTTEVFFTISMITLDDHQRRRVETYLTKHLSTRRMK